MTPRPQADFQPPNKPFYKKLWFIILCIITGIVLVAGVTYAITVSFSEERTDNAETQVDEKVEEEDSDKIESVEDNSDLDITRNADGTIIFDRRDEDDGLGIRYWIDNEVILVGICPEGECAAVFTDKDQKIRSENFTKQIEIHLHNYELGTEFEIAVAGRSGNYACEGWHGSDVVSESNAEDDDGAVCRVLPLARK